MEILVEWIEKLVAYAGLDKVYTTSKIIDDYDSNTFKIYFSFDEALQSLNMTNEEYQAQKDKTTFAYRIVEIDLVEAAKRQVDFNKEYHDGLMRELNEYRSHTQEIADERFTQLCNRLIRDIKKAKSA